MHRVIFSLFIFLAATCFSMTLKAKPGLNVGDPVPEVQVRDSEGTIFKFHRQSGATVVVFYRGSWCPYCIKQLQSIQQEVMGKIPQKVQLVAVSVDQKKVAQKMRRKFGFQFRVLSDPQAKSLEAFKIVNQLSDELVEKYKNSYKIDVEADSGEKHHKVAHPAVFILKDGKVIFSDVHTDYKQRTENAVIIETLLKSEK